MAVVVIGHLENARRRRHLAFLSIEGDIFCSRSARYSDGRNDDVGMVGQAGDTRLARRLFFQPADMHIEALKTWRRKCCRLRYHRQCKASRYLDWRCVYVACAARHLIGRSAKICGAWHFSAKSPAACRHRKSCMRKGNVWRRAMAPEISGASHLLAPPPAMHKMRRHQRQNKLNASTCNFAWHALGAFA